MNGQVPSQVVNEEVPIEILNEEGPKRVVTGKVPAKAMKEEVPAQEGHDEVVCIDTGYSMYGLRGKFTGNTANKVSYQQKLESCRNFNRWSWHLDFYAAVT